MKTIPTYGVKSRQIATVTSDTTMHTSSLSFRFLVLCFLLSLLPACQGRRATPSSIDEIATPSYTPRYAKGFEIYDLAGTASTLVKIKNPWQGASDVLFEYLILRDDSLRVPSSFSGKVLRGEPRRIVALSSSYVAMLDDLHEGDRLVAVSGLEYIHSPHLRARADEVTNLTYPLQYELLVGTAPDLVLMYGVDGAQTAENDKLDQLEIPYFYMAEHIEPSPLGRAEWMVLLGEIVGKREMGEAKFRAVESAYKHIQAKTKDVEQRPTVMLNLPWNDAWMLPPSNSFMISLIRDAGGEPVYTALDGNEVQTIGMEQALDLLARADFWLNIGQITKYDELPSPLRAKARNIKSIVNNHLYNNNARLTAGGGSDFFESAVVHPDEVLADLITILHPEISTRPLKYMRHIEVPR